MDYWIYQLHFGVTDCISIFLCFELYIIADPEVGLVVLNAASTIWLVDVACTDGDCADANKDHLPNNEELQRINDELEAEYVFALKKVKICISESCFLHILNE